MFELPSSLNIGGKEYPIRNKGDYRMVLDCFEALKDAELEESYRVLACLIIFYDGMDSVLDLTKTFSTPELLKEACDKMYDFFNCGEPQCGREVQYEILDWNKDSQMICSAVNTVAGREIRADVYLHWWTFMGYFLAIGRCALSNVLSIRYKIKSGKKLDDFEKQFKRDNPNYFMWNDKTVEQKDLETQLREAWNNGGIKF